MHNLPLIERAAHAISKRSRAQKFSQFLDAIMPKSDETIIDVGINTEEYSESDNYLEKHYPHPERITAVGVGDMSGFEKRYPEVRAISGDGKLLPFEENAFDISYSNAVIEHVGTRDDQLRFLKELYRVGKRGYLTTPNRFFPIEVHTRVPFLHILLPKKYFDNVLRCIGKSWATGSYMRLLSEKDLRSLIDQADIKEYTILKNRFFGFPLTFTLIWNKTPLN